MYIGKHVTIRYNKWVYRARAQQRQSTGGAQWGSLAQVFDLNAQTIAITKVLLYHITEIVNRQYEMRKALDLSSHDNVLKQGATSNRQHWLGTVFRVGP
jgi:hypothetical protein